MRVSYAYWDFLRDWKVGIKYAFKQKGLKFLARKNYGKKTFTEQGLEVFHLTYTPSSDVQGLRSVPHDFEMTQLRLTSDRSRFSYKSTRLSATACNILPSTPSTCPCPLPSHRLTTELPLWLVQMETSRFHNCHARYNTSTCACEQGPLFPLVQLTFGHRPTAALDSWDCHKRQIPNGDSNHGPWMTRWSLFSCL